MTRRERLTRLGYTVRLAALPDDADFAVSHRRRIVWLDSGLVPYRLDQALTQAVVMIAGRDTTPPPRPAS